MAFTDLVDESFTKEVFHGQAGQLTGIEEWESLVKSGDLKKIKKTVRANNWQPNHSIRSRLWQDLCGFHCKQHSSIYNETVNDIFGTGSHSHDVSLPAFVDPTRMMHYHLKPQGVYTAKRIMCVLGNTNPDVIHAPTVFPLTCALLHYLPEEKVYDVVYGLLTSNKGFVNQTKLSHSTSAFILKDLARNYSKGWYNQLLRNSADIDKIIAEWTWWILDSLPFSHMIRVLDCYFVEGPKVMFRIALAILNAYQKNTGQANYGKSTGEISSAIAQFCEDLPIPIDKLLKSGFGIRGLSRKEINKLSVKNEMFVKSMKHANSHQMITKSASCESLALKVSRSFSGPITFQANSSLINTDMWQSIWKWLPRRIALYQPNLIYTSNEHGTSIKTFYNLIEEHEPTLIILKTSKGDILGAYCSTDWAERKNVENKNLQYFGTGECFLFTIHPKPVKYEWVGKELKEQTPHSGHLFMAGDNTKFTIGGGGGEGLQLNGDLEDGRTDKCDTFGNPPLVDSKDFKCVCVEVFGFFE